MRIDDLNRPPVTPGAEKADPAAEKRGLAKETFAAPGTDQADVSQLAQALATRDPQRIEHLRLEVQSGKYDVSAETVAKALIDAHLKP
jgi:anti-sigma28 factor (negative regulator of flagellin synthesis)